MKTTEYPEYLEQLSDAELHELAGRIVLRFLNEMLSHTQFAMQYSQVMIECLRRRKE